MGHELSCCQLKFGHRRAREDVSDFVQPRKRMRSLVLLIQLSAHQRYEMDRAENEKIACYVRGDSTQAEIFSVSLLLDCSNLSH